MVERIALTMVILILHMLFSQINREQAELARANFSILRKEAQSILDLVSVYSWRIVWYLIEYLA